MVAVTVPTAVGAVVAVSPWSIMLSFSGVCVTVPPIHMFYVAPALCCCVLYKVIILSSNESVMFFMIYLVKLIFSAGFGVGVGMVWGGEMCFGGRGGGD